MVKQAIQITLKLSEPESGILNVCVFRHHIRLLTNCIDFEAVLQYNVRGEYTIHNGKA